jgi:elongation factor 2
MMPRFRQTAEIIKLMSRKERIRNVGVIAHIDHGKTTLTDSLLVEAGLLAPQVAGSARVLDYLEEEQKRGITIKTANISFVHETDGESYLINLVDTPGHVDFTGKVARAMRAIDGAIVVVDSVEEVMAQTETVMRQALEERVKPVLFINKVDRLISELRLSPSEIQKKFIRIIKDFNSIIEIYGEREFREQWKVDPAKESVVFGSALHRWGFTLDIAEKKGIKFSGRDIMDAYEQRTFANLSETIPLHAAILNMIIKNIPSPIESQKYRVPKIWKGKLDSEIGEAMLNCSDTGPMVMCITAVQMFPAENLVATGRLFSGSVKQGDHVYLVGARKDHYVQKVSIYMSAFRETVDQVSAGNIVAVTGFESARTGETVVDLNHAKLSVPFEGARHVSLPVMTVAIEPKNPKDLERVHEAINRLSVEDPSLETSMNKETGQYLISGMGELHLEVALNFLKQYVGALELRTSAPIASYRETILEKGALVMAKSPNKLNRFFVQVEPLDKKTVEILEKDLPATEKLEKTASRLAEGDILALNEHVNILADLTEICRQFQDVTDSVISGFHWACRTGPLCEQPLRGVKVKLMNAQVDLDATNREPKQVIRALSRAILGSFLTAKPTLLEPIFKIEITVPLQWLGKCSNIIIRKRGKIASTRQKGPLATILGYVPVAEALGLSSELRSATSGRAFWQLAFDRWEKMPKDLSHTVVEKLREKRGLPSQIPRPEMFIDEISP